VNGGVAGDAGDLIGDGVISGVGWLIDGDVDATVVLCQFPELS
jgi:2-keto-4-pentenoate hydratase/2-oxohepta-3-ene-1,7-dioic acid hydratase in catechol pathway